MFGKVKESEQHLNINWKHFYLSVLALVIPMALQNLINVGVTAGRLGSMRFRVLLWQGRDSIL